MTRRLKFILSAMAVLGLGVTIGPTGLDDVFKQELPHVSIGFNLGGENGLNGWQASGGTLTATTIDPYKGQASLQWDASGAQQMDSDPWVVNHEMGGVKCQALVAYKGGGTADLTLAIRDFTGSEVLGSVVVTNALADWRTTLFDFTCPPEGDFVNFRINSAGDAAAVQWEVAYLSRAVFIQGAAITPWTVYTPAFQGMGSQTNVSFEFRQVGDSYSIRGTWTTGTSTSDEAQVGLPSVTIEDSITDAQIVAGKVERDSSTSQGLYTNAIMTGGDTFINFSRSDGTDVLLDPQDGDTIFGNSLRWSIHLTGIPIEGLDAGITLGNSSTFLMSNVLTNGTQITTAAEPAVLGEFKVYTKTVSATTGTVDSGVPDISAADGMDIFCEPFASAGTTTEPNRWEIFVGRNRESGSIQLNAYENAGKSGAVDPTFNYEGVTTSVRGLTHGYDKASGIFFLDCIEQSATTTSRRIGKGIPTDGAGTTAPTSGFFELTISENALAVGVEVPKDIIHLYSGNGFGSSGTRIRRYTSIAFNLGDAMTLTQDATNGDSITINETGRYSVIVADRGDSGGCSFGISKNAPSLSTNISSITDVNVFLGMTGTITANDSNNVPRTPRFAQGDVIRSHGNADCDNTTQHFSWFVIEKISD